MNGASDVSQVQLHARPINAKQVLSRALGLFLIRALGAALLILTTAFLFRQ